MNNRRTVGFGTPDEMDPHHMIVDIPAGRDKDVTISEQFGLRSGTNGLPEAVERCIVKRTTWASVSEDAKRLLNSRLKEKGLPTSRWVTGLNRVERLLGRELCVLIWAVECAPKSLTANAVRNWVALRPEERWWLFSMAATSTGTSEDADIGWRKAIRVALTENPTADVSIARKSRLPRADSEQELPLLLVPRVDADRP